MHKILCKIGLHEWGEWLTDAYRANWIIRQCKVCFRFQSRRLF